MAKRFCLPPEEYEALKLKVYQRDQFKCRACGASGVTAHHVVFRSEGGGDFSHNLVSLCSRKCHLAVHGRNGKDFLQILAGDGDPDKLPDANYGLKFRRYVGVRRRITWRFPKT